MISFELKAWNNLTSKILNKTPSTLKKNRDNTKTDDEFTRWTKGSNGMRIREKEER